MFYLKRIWGKMCGTVSRGVTRPYFCFYIVPTDDARCAQNFGQRSFVVSRYDARVTVTCTIHKEVVGSSGQSEREAAN